MTSPTGASAPNQFTSDNFPLAVYLIAVTGQLPVARSLSAKRCLFQFEWSDDLEAYLEAYANNRASINPAQYDAARARLLELIADAKARFAKARGGDR